MNDDKYKEAEKIIDESSIWIDNKLLLKSVIARAKHLETRVERYETALQTIIKDSELFNTTTKKTTYSYPGKVAKKAIEG